MAPARRRVNILPPGAVSPGMRSSSIPPPPFRYTVVILPDREDALLATVAERGGEVTQRDYLHPASRPYRVSGGETRYAPTPPRVRLVVRFREHTTGLRGALAEHTRGVDFHVSFVRLDAGSPRPRPAKTPRCPVTPKRLRPRLTVIQGDAVQRFYFDTPAEAVAASWKAPATAQVRFTRCGPLSEHAPAYDMKEPDRPGPLFPLFDVTQRR